MKRILGFLVAASLAVPAMTYAAPLIDGFAEPALYGSAITTQQLGTTAQDNTVIHKAAASGSELDAAYGFISNGVLYLVIAGNIDSGSNSPPAVAFDKLSIFFETGPDGENVLTNDSPSGAYGPADFGRLRNMAGLKFDAGFAPNYWMGFTSGGVGTNPTFYANFARMRRASTNDPGPAYFLGQSSPPNYLAITNTVVAGTSASNAIIVAILNSNTVGVAGDPSGCASNGAPLSPGSVRTGVELAIPVAAIGASTGSVKICAFLTEDQYTNAYNQVLPPVDTNGCVGSFGATPTVDFSVLPGQQYFTIASPPCTFGLSPISANFPPTGGTGTVSIVVAGPCPWSATSNVPWVTITSATNGTGAGTISFSVGTNATLNGRQGLITLLVPPSPPLTFAVNQFGLPLGLIPVDGTASCSNYGPPLAIQQIETVFGDSTAGTVEPSSSGSELDAAYGIILDGVMYLVLAGNLENNFNKIEIFFDTGPGGQNTLTNINPNVDFDGLNRMGAGCGSCGDTGLASNVGLTFDSDFAADYYISVTGGGSPYALYANYAELWPGGGGTNGYFLGQTAAPTNGTLFGGTNPFGIQATINNSNTLGVPGTASGCYADPSLYGQDTVTTGVGLGIPLGALGSPTGAVKVCAFVNGSSHNFLSQQALGPFWDGTSFYCLTNLGEPTVVNFAAEAGTQYFVVGPEMRITSITRVATNVVIGLVTSANTNLLYRVQSSLDLSNPTVWSAASPFIVGSGGPTNVTIINGATNNPARFFRGQQVPGWTCP